MQDESAGLLLQACQCAGRGLRPGMLRRQFRACWAGVSLCRTEKAIGGLGRGATAELVGLFCGCVHYGSPTI